MLGLIIFFLVSIVFSFLCSIWEAVYLKITPSYRELLIQKGDPNGKLLLKWQKDQEPLSAILTLNTIAHTVGAMGVGAQAEKIWASSTGISVFGLFNIGTSAIIGTVMTLAILILSEIIPKTLGANNWSKLAPFTVRSLSFIIALLQPLVWLSKKITKQLKNKNQESDADRASLTAMAKLGEKEGEIEQGESKIIQNLLRFNTIQVKSIMTPRTVVKAADENMSIKDFYEENKNLYFSRIPVFKETKDHINGFVLKDEILASIINDNGDLPLKDIMREIMIVKEDALLPETFNTLMEKREHIALVIGEFGGMAGIVTMEDVIETLLGMEIVDELDNIEDMQLLARKNWEKRAKNLGIINNEPEE